VTEEKKETTQEGFDPTNPPHPEIPWLWGPYNSPRPLPKEQSAPESPT
jgi:hypothetical protein